MTMPNQVAKTDDGISQALAILDDNREFLNQHLATGQRIQQEVASNFVAGASTTFQQKLDDWVTVCRGVIDSFNTLELDLRGANQELDSSNDNAMQVAGSWVSDNAFGVLTGG